MNPIHKVMSKQTSQQTSGEVGVATDQQTSYFQQLKYNISSRGYVKKATDRIPSVRMSRKEFEEYMKHIITYRLPNHIFLKYEQELKLCLDIAAVYVDKTINVDMNLYHSISLLPLLYKRTKITMQDKSKNKENIINYCNDLQSHIGKFNFNDLVTTFKNQYISADFANAAITLMILSYTYHELDVFNIIHEMISILFTMADHTNTLQVIRCLFWHLTKLICTAEDYMLNIPMIYHQIYIHMADDNIISNLGAISIKYKNEIFIAKNISYSFLQMFDKQYEYIQRSKNDRYDFWYNMFLVSNCYYVSNIYRMEYAIWDWLVSMDKNYTYNSIKEFNERYENEMNQLDHFKYMYMKLVAKIENNKQDDKDIQSKHQKKKWKEFKRKRNEILLSNKNINIIYQYIFVDNTTVQLKGANTISHELTTKTINILDEQLNHYTKNKIHLLGCNVYERSILNQRYKSLNYIEIFDRIDGIMCSLANVILTFVENQPQTRMILNTADNFAKFRQKNLTFDNQHHNMTIQNLILLYAYNSINDATCESDEKLFEWYDKLVAQKDIKNIHNDNQLKEFMNNNKIHPLNRYWYDISRILLHNQLHWNKSDSLSRIFLYILPKSIRNIPRRIFRIFEGIVYNAILNDAHMLDLHSLFNIMHIYSYISVIRNSVICYITNLLQKVNSIESLNYEQVDTYATYINNTIFEKIVLLEEFVRLLKVATDRKNGYISITEFYNIFVDHYKQLITVISRDDNNNNDNNDENDNICLNLSKLHDNDILDEKKTIVPKDQIEKIYQKYIEEKYKKNDNNNNDNNNNTNTVWYMTINEHKLVYPDDDSLKQNYKTYTNENLIDLYHKCIVNFIEGYETISIHTEQVIGAEVAKQYASKSNQQFVDYIQSEINKRNDKTRCIEDQVHLLKSKIPILYHIAKNRGLLQSIHNDKVIIYSPSREKEETSTDYASIHIKNSHYTPTVNDHVIDEARRDRMREAEENHIRNDILNGITYIGRGCANPKCAIRPLSKKIRSDNRYVQVKCNGGCTIHYHEQCYYQYIRSLVRRGLYLNTDVFYSQCRAHNAACLTSDCCHPITAQPSIIQSILLYEDKKLIREITQVIIKSESKVDDNKDNKYNNSDDNDVLSNYKDTINLQVSQVPQQTVTEQYEYESILIEKKQKEEEKQSKQEINLERAVTVLSTNNNDDNNSNTKRKKKKKKNNKNNKKNILSIEQFNEIIDSLPAELVTIPEILPAAPGGITN
jgi:hypothetical protein